MPDVDEDQRIESKVRRREHGRAPDQAKPLEHIVGDEAPGARQHDLPEQADHDRRHHRRHEQERDQRRAAADVLIEHQRAGKSEHELDRHSDRHEDKGDADGVPETPVGEQGEVVLKADEVGDAAVLGFMEAQEDRVGERHQRYDGEREHRRRDEKVGIPERLPPPGRDGGSCKLWKLGCDGHVPLVELSFRGPSEAREPGMTQTNQRPDATTCTSGRST